MALIRWQPTQTSNARDDFDRFFHNFWPGNQVVESALRNWSPVVDISESADDYTLTAELPGVAKADVQVGVVDNRLTLKGEKKQETRAEKETTPCVERVYGSFSRSFDLPKTVKAEKITASYRDGVLKVVVPKAEEAKSKQIEINVN